MSRHAGISLLLAIAFLLRLTWSLLQPPQVDQRLPDQNEYLELAQSLLKGEGLRFYDERFWQYVHAYRMPGYPLFIAAFGASVKLVRIAQSILDTSTILATYLLARRWLGKTPSLLAAAAIAFNPFLIYFSALILSETLFTSLLLWGLLLLLVHPNYLRGGIMLALSVLVRPSAAALPILMGIISIFIHNTPGLIPPRRSWFRIPVATTMLLLVLLVLLPWAIRNRLTLRQWVWLTTNGGATRYDGFNPDATGASDQRFLASPQMRFMRHMSEVARDDYLSQQAHLYIRQTLHHDAPHLLQLTALKVARTWSPIPLSADFGSKRHYKIAAATYSIPLFVLSVVGLWAARLPRSGKLFLLAPILYFTMIHAVTVGSLRYRVPTEPLLAILAAAGLMALLDRLKQR